MGKRKRHTEEFKREAVRLMETRGNRSIADVAESLGVLTNQLYDWRHKFGDVRQAVRDERGETPEEELKRLRRDVARLTREREILVKAAAFFAKENG